MREGWYLMSTSELEEALSAWRSSDREHEAGIRLSIEEALALKQQGNVPDAEGRTLRLVLYVDGEPLERKRLRFEPDLHEEPTWRTSESRPINVVPLRTGAVEAAGETPWWELPRVRELEAEWRETGGVAGVEVPAAYRSFVFKTVIALQDAGVTVTADSIGASIARWLSPEDAARVRSALKSREPG